MEQRWTRRSDLPIVGGAMLLRACMIGLENVTAWHVTAWMFGAALCLLVLFPLVRGMRI